jgi:DNA-binding NtrC family response regulator
MIDMRTILVFEPDLAIGNLIAEVLGDDGYRVRLARDRIGLVKALTTTKPDLLLYSIDRDQTHTTAWPDTVDAIAALAVPIVPMTTEPAWVASPGNTEYLAKPFDLYELLDCVARHLRPREHTV